MERPGRHFKLCLYFGLIFFRVVSVPRFSIALGFVAGSSISFAFVLMFVLSPGSPFTFSCVMLFCDSIFLQIINIFIFRKYLFTIDYNTLGLKWHWPEFDPYNEMFVHPNVQRNTKYICLIINLCTLPLHLLKHLDIRSSFCTHVTSLYNHKYIWRPSVRMLLHIIYIEIYIILYACYFIYN